MSFTQTCACRIFDLSVPTSCAAHARYYSCIPEASKLGLTHLEQLVNLRKDLLGLLLDAGAVVVRYLPSKVDGIVMDDRLAHVWVSCVEPRDLRIREHHADR